MRLMMGSETVKVIIVGATHAGTVAALQILALDPTVDVTVYERGSRLAFIGAGVPLYLSQQVTKIDELLNMDVATLTHAGATMRMQHDVLKIDMTAKTILVQNLITNEQFEDHYDKLVMATGSAVVVPPLYGVNNHRVLMIKDYQSTKDIAGAVQHAHSIVIAGGGYIGVELAEALCQRHDITLYHSASYLLDNYYDRPMARSVQKLLTQHGVHVCVNEPVKSFTETRDTLTVVSRNLRKECDLAIVCTGFVPVSNLVQGQVELDRGGAIITNKYGQTSDPNVYAAGDDRNSHQNATGEFQYLPQVTNAIRQAQIVAYHICGTPIESRGTQGTTALSIFNHTYTMTGITEHRARLLKIPAKSITYQGWYRPQFMTKNARVTVTLIYRADNWKILGAQIRCQHDVTQSINIVSLAIQNQNTIVDLAFTDMFFHPRYNQPVNYVKMAAQQALFLEKGKQ